MGADAHVDVITLLIEGNHRVLGKVIDQFHLVVLIPVRKKLQGLFSGYFRPLQGKVLLDYPLHLLLDRRKIFFGEPVVDVDVVIEAVIDSGAYCEFCFRPDVLDGLGHDV